MRELSPSVDLTQADRDYIEAALPGLYAPTRLTYARDLVRFSLFFDVAGGGRLCHLDRFLFLDAPAAHALTWHYRDQMMRDELGPATINRRLTALRAFCRRAQQTGRIVWSLEVPGLDAPPAKFYLITPGDIAHLISELSEGPDALEPRRARDACAIRLTWDLALRRSELLLLDVDDVDLGAGVVLVRKKGKSDKKAVRLPERSQNAIERWLTIRRATVTTSPALFVQFETLPPGGRLSERGFHAMVARRTRQILGKALNPHALRHASITCALDQTNGNVARVGTGFAGHADIRTTIRYDDMRRGDGAAIAQLVSESVPEPLPSRSIASFAARASVPGSSSALISPSSSRVSASARASVGLHLTRNSAERSANLAAASLRSLAVDAPPPALCSTCRSSDPGRLGWIDVAADGTIVAVDGKIVAGDDAAETATRRVCSRCVVIG